MTEHHSFVGTGHSTSGTKAQGACAPDPKVYIPGDAGFVINGAGLDQADSLVQLSGPCWPWTGQSNETRRSSRRGMPPRRRCLQLGPLRTARNRSARPVAREVHDDASVHGTQRVDALRAPASPQHGLRLPRDRFPVLCSLASGQRYRIHRTDEAHWRTRIRLDPLALSDTAILNYHPLQDRRDCRKRQERGAAAGAPGCREHHKLEISACISGHACRVVVGRALPADVASSFGSALVDALPDAVSGSLRCRRACGAVSAE